MGIEQGNTVLTGPPSASDPAKSPVKRAYNLFGVTTRPAWGQLGILYAVRGLSKNFLVLGQAGTNTINPVSGNNAWTQSPDRGQSFLGKVAQDSEIQAILNGLFGDAPFDHLPFFSGETPLSKRVYYLRFSNGASFGYYSHFVDPAYIYHFDLGFEYIYDAGDGHAGLYFYDFASDTFWYTSPTFPFPYLYDFGLQAFLYYYPDPTDSQRYNTNGVRYFYNFSTGKIISK